MADITPIHSPSVNHAIGPTPLYNSGASRASSAADFAAARGRSAEGVAERPGESAAPVDRSAERPSDRVDISDRARLLAKMASMPPIRQDLVDEIRAQIARDEYDTPERLDVALEQLLDELT